MRSLTATELLDAWERGLSQASIEPSIMVLSAACPDASPDALARLSIGRRDSSLLALREMIFGPQILSLAACPECRERVELAFKVSDIRAMDESEQSDSFSLGVGEYQVSFRLPNTLDLAVIASQKDVEQSRRLLFDRCVIEAACNGDRRSPDQLPSHVFDAVAKRMAELDPQADTQLALSCPSCGHKWEAAFDIASFFWSEVNSWAYAILRDTHKLASAYGWSESDILSMTAWRRQLYLEIAGK
jgi:hypothetical protein